MASLREIAGCIGLSGSISVVEKIFGYTHIPRPLSILTQVRLLQGRHIDMNLIIVGHDAFIQADQEEIDRAVDFARETYATVDVGIGLTDRYYIHTNEANGRHIINDDSEAKDLTQEWTVGNSALDVFFVLQYDGTTSGLSPKDGTCSKDRVSTMTGCVVELIDTSGMVDFSRTGFVLAHEVGHYLGLNPYSFEHPLGDPSHSPDANNLMFATVPNGGVLTERQGEVMREHCSVRSPCSM